MSTRTYGDGSCDNVFRPTTRQTAGMHAAVKPETDAQLHARLTAMLHDSYGVNYLALRARGLRLSSTGTRRHRHARFRRHHSTR